MGDSGEPYLRRYLHEYMFHFNLRTSKSVGKIPGETCKGPQHLYEYLFIEAQ